MTALSMSYALGACYAVLEKYQNLRVPLNLLNSSDNFSNSTGTALYDSRTSPQY